MRDRKGGDRLHELPRAFGDDEQGQHEKEMIEPEKNVLDAEFEIGAAVAQGLGAAGIVASGASGVSRATQCSPEANATRTSASVMVLLRSVDQDSSGLRGARSPACARSEPWRRRLGVRRSARRTRPCPTKRPTAPGASPSDFRISHCPRPQLLAHDAGHSRQLLPPLTGQSRLGDPNLARPGEVEEVLVAGASG